MRTLSVPLIGLLQFFWLFSVESMLSWQNPPCIAELHPCVINSEELDWLQINLVEAGRLSKELRREEVRDILEGGSFDELRGAVENEQLECKVAPYQLDNNYHKQELAKDVSALANADGGIILIGVRTISEPTLFVDIIVEIRPFEQTLVDRQKYLDSLEAWIYPPLYQVEVKWFPSSKESDKGIVAITIPSQPHKQRPFLVTRIVDLESGMAEIVFGYCERVRDKVDSMSVERLHSLLKDGLNYAQMLKERLDRIEEAIGNLPSQISGPTPPVPSGPSTLEQLQNEHRPKAEEAMDEKN